MNVLQSEMTVKVFDKVLRSNLHYIYKHYDNLKKKDPSAFRQLENNLLKVKRENQNFNQKN